MEPWKLQHESLSDWMIRNWYGFTSFTIDSPSAANGKAQIQYNLQSPPIDEYVGAGAPQQVDMPFDILATAGVYYGRLAYPLPEPTTPFYMVFPGGIYNGAQCFVLSSFARDFANNVNWVLTSITPRVTLIGDTEFVLKKPNDRTDEQYWFKGKISANGTLIDVRMFTICDDELCAKVSLQKANQSPVS